MSGLESVHHYNGQYQARDISDEARVEIHTADLVFLAAVDEEMITKRILHVFLRYSEDDATVATRQSF